MRGLPERLYLLRPPRSAAQYEPGLFNCNRISAAQFDPVLN